MKKYRIFMPVLLVALIAASFTGMFGSVAAQQTQAPATAPVSAASSNIAASQPVKPAPAGKSDSGKNKVVDGVACSDIPRYGIDKQMNVHAAIIMAACGLSPASHGASPRSGGNMSLPANYGGSDVDIILPDGTYPNVTQSESFVWGHGNVIVVNYNDSRTEPNCYSGTSYSTDGGATFHAGQPLCTGHGTNFGDPTVVWDNAHALWVATDLASGCGGQGVGAWHSPDGITWTAGGCALNSSQGDRNSSWVDNNPGSPHYGTVYSSYNDFNVGGGALFVSHSTDGGNTWSAGVQLANGTPFIRDVQLTGAADGTVLEAGMDENGGGLGNRSNLFYRSSDGGATFTQVYSGPTFYGAGRAASGYFAGMYTNPAGYWRYMSWGQPAAGPQIGGQNVFHYIYTMGIQGTDPGNIMYIRSTDNGVTWSTPLQLNTDSTTRAQWMPSLAATSSGAILASWYDERDTTSCGNPGANTPCYRRYGRVSVDNGASWQLDQPIGDSVSPLPDQPDGGIQPLYAGDYDYSSADGNAVFTTWTDGRSIISGSSQQDVNFDKVNMLTGPTGNIIGRVTASNDGSGIAGATIAAQDSLSNTLYVGSTNASGFYTLTVPVTPTYNMTASKTFFQSAYASGVTVISGSNTVRNFVLTPTVGSIVGLVTDASNNNPISGAAISANGPTTATTSTDVSGHYTLTNLLPGSYTVTATKYLYIPGSVPASVTAGITTTANIALTPSPSYTVSGTVTGPHGPLDNVLITVVGTPVTTTTSGGGHYSYNIPAGSYTVLITPTLLCVNSATDTVTVPPSQTKNYTLPAKHDTFGYSCDDSVAYAYDTATSQITNFTSQDDGSAQLSLPFAFNFYGVNHAAGSSIYAITNGNIQFSGPSTAFSPDQIPSAAIPNDAVYGIWTDLIIQSGEGVYTSVVGTAPNRRYVIEWRNVSIYPGTGGTVNFEIELEETTNNIYVNYGSVSQTDTFHNATLGIENPNGTDALQYAYFAPGDMNQMSGKSVVYYITPLGTPTPTVTGTPPTNTPTATPTATPCIGNYTVMTSTMAIVTGTNDIGLHIDDGTQAIPLDFPFSFYGSSYSNANISSNGNLQFISSAIDYSNAALPYITFNSAILPFWDDLSTAGTGEGVFTSTTGTSPNRIENIEWRAEHFSTAGTFNFEIRLHEGSGQIDLVYGTLTDGTNNNGSSATVGLQKDTGSQFSQYSYNQAVLSPTLQISYTYSDPCQGTPTPVVTGTPPTATSTPVVTNTPGGPTDTPAATDTPAPPSVTPTDCPNPFTDITGNVFYGAIHYLNCRGVVGGIDATHYNPGGTSTRGQFAKVVVLGFNIPLTTPASGQTFTDVPPSYFAYVYIETGYAAGVLNGFDAAGCTSHGATFPCYLPNLAITRGQLTKLVVSAGGCPLYTPTTPDFIDVPASNVFYVSIETAYHNSVINGYPDHTFRPNNNIRRDEMAQIVYEGILHCPRATVTPAPATNTPAAATNTPAPATNTPAPATNTPAATSTPVPTNTPAPTNTPSPTSTPGVVNVNITGFQYTPQTLTVTVGTTVVWTNNGTIAHTVTSDPGAMESFDSGNMAVGAVFTHTFTMAGTDGYHCLYHGAPGSGMFGTVIVTAGARTDQ